MTDHLTATGVSPNFTERVLNAILRGEDAEAIGVTMKTALEVAGALLKEEQIIPTSDKGKRILARAACLWLDRMWPQYTYIGPTMLVFQELLRPEKTWCIATITVNQGQQDITVGADVGGNISPV